MTQLIGGRYEPVRLLGEGGSASVHLVRDRVLGGAPLALKLLPVSHAELALQEFRRLRAFHYPGIPRALELGLDAGSGALFFTSEACEGPDFLAALRGAPLREQLAACADLLRTLVLLDERGVIHRDLKPQNLVVETPPRPPQGGAPVALEPRVRLLDFGLAMERETVRELAGSLPWLAPELFAGAAATHASDLYALGVVLFELWVGAHPFSAATPTDWARAHQQRPVQFPPGCSLPASLRRIVERLLAKEPRQRYAHAAEVLTDLSRTSSEPLPRATPRTLHGRIRSVPRFEPPWREEIAPPHVTDSARAGGPITWVTAPTRAGRDELMRDLRAEAVSSGACPIVIGFGQPPADAWAPREMLAAQLQAAAAAAPSADTARGEPAFEELVRALRQDPLARRVVVFLEEADQRTSEQEALQKLLLRAPVEVVLSAASSPDDDPLLRVLFAESGARRLEPRPIELAELERAFPAWIGGAFPPELGRFLGAEQGIDLPRLVETLAYLVDCGALQVDDGVTRLHLAAADLGTVGGDLLDVVHRRVALLEPEARAALEALAVIGDAAAPELVTALEPAALPAVLSRLVEQGLAERENLLLQCASGAVRAAALARLDRSRARALHGRAATLLATAAPTLDQALAISRHRFRADPNGATGLDYARAGLVLVEGARYPEAGEIAAEVLAGGISGESEAAARLLEGTVQMHRKTFEQAEQTLAAAAVALVDPMLQARCRSEHARAVERRGRYAEALAELEAAAPAIYELHPATLAQRAYLLHLLQRDVEAEAACREAFAGLPVTADLRHLRLLNIHGTVLWRLGRPEEARARFRRGIEAAAAIGLPAAGASHGCNLGRLEEDLGRLGEAVAIVRHSVELAALYGDRELEALAGTLVAQTLFDLGRTDEAKRELQRARESLHAMRRAPQDLRRIALQQAQLAIAEGEHEAALAALDESRSLAESVQDFRGVFLADVVRSDVHLRRGEVKAARRLLDDLGRRAAAQGQAELLGYLAEYRLEHAVFAGSRADVRAGLAAMPDPGRSVKRRAQMDDARLRALARLGEDAARATLAQEAAARLEGTDLVALHAHALTSYCAARVAAATPAELSRLEAAARAGLSEVTAPGHAWRKAEAALELGEALGDARLAAEAAELAGRARHLPLVRRAERLRRRLAGAAGGTVGGAGPRTATEGRDAEMLTSLEQLKEVAKTISATTDGARLLRLLLDHAVEKTGARRGFLILIRGTKMSVPVARNIDANDIANPEFSVSSSVARRVAEDGRACMLSDVRTDERFRHASSISQLKLLSVLCVPLRSRGELVGSLYLDDPTRVDSFDESDLRYVEDLSDFAAIALEKANLLRANVERQRELERTNKALEETKREVERLNRELERTVARQAVELSEVKASLERTRQELSLRYDYAAIVSQSPAMLEVLRKLDLFTDSDLPLFVSGESGTGKELIARHLHSNGPRKEKELASVNCASLPGPLIESELFGYVRGAFTGADKDKPGLFERADGGTLFLDEVCDASLELQAKLLRAIQFGEVQRLGDGAVHKVDVRLVAASNKEVKKEVANGRFREDLMFRLDVLQVHLPPLRERPEDIPLLIEHFLKIHAADQGARPLTFSAAASRLLSRHAWPGNVRELQNLVQRMLVLHPEGGEIEERDLPESLREHSEALPVRPGDLRAAVEVAERAAIVAALDWSRGNRARAAESLGISERALYQKLSRYGLSGGRDSGKP